jgi:hypothetical protein
VVDIVVGQLAWKVIVTLVLPEGTYRLTHVIKSGLRLAWKSYVWPAYVTTKE